MSVLHAEVLNISMYYTGREPCIQQCLLAAERGSAQDMRGKELTRARKVRVRYRTVQFMIN